MPYKVQEVLAPGGTITDALQSKISLWGVHVSLGHALLVSAQASGEHLYSCRLTCGVRLIYVSLPSN